MEYKIVASDLDETLLEPNQGVSKENFDAIATLTRRGVHFVPSTGRAFDEIPADIKESQWIRYYIVSDGTQVYDKKTGKTWEYPMDRQTVKTILDRVYQHPVCLTVHAGTSSFVEKRTHNERDYRTFHMSDYWIRFLLSAEKPMEGLKEFCYRQESLLSLVVFFQNMEDLHACRAYFETMPEIQMAQTAPNNLEIFSSKAGKGNALALLASILGATLEECIAVGDSGNDSTMVRAAGLGLAVENAVPALKEIADEEICHYKDHVVKHIFQHYFH